MGSSACETLIIGASRSCLSFSFSRIFDRLTCNPRISHSYYIDPTDMFGLLSEAHDRAPSLLSAPLKFGRCVKFGSGSVALHCMRLHQQSMTAARSKAKAAQGYHVHNPSYETGKGPPPAHTEETAKQGALALATPTDQSHARRNSSDHSRADWVNDRDRTDEQLRCAFAFRLFCSTS